MTIYFDNAATSHPKPEQVYQACDQALRAGGSAGRGTHKLALAAAIRHFESRERIASYLGIADSSRLIFTGGCTASINMVLNGLRGAGRLKAGDCVLVSSFEHNAVMRPLHALALELGLKIVPVPTDILSRDPLSSNPLSSDPLSDQTQAKAMIEAATLQKCIAEHRPALCIFSRASNVTGSVLDLEALGPVFRNNSYPLPLLIDAAQSAGSVAENLTADDFISFWVASAHKGLLGPPGLGLLYIKAGEEINCAWRGGTGSILAGGDGFAMPEVYPDRLEPGTQAVHLLCGLAAGVEFLSQRQAEYLEHELNLSRYFLAGLEALGERLRLVGRPLQMPSTKSERSLHYLPVFSLAFASMSPEVVAQRLDSQYDMATRAGLHCALAAHQTLGTAEEGLLRISFGLFNEVREVEALLLALAEITAS